ncbi:MAG: DUF4339 domain-containing protein [Holophagales bacterium]|nr:DUF4339 domain-containing protein [Holophagales bacterium]
MAEELWFYEKDGEQHGPVTLAELRGRIERGELSRDNLAWKPGETDWNETGTFEVLVPSFRTPPPISGAPPPPPPPPPIPSDAVPGPVPAAGEAPRPETSPEPPARSPESKQEEPEELSWGQRLDAGVEIWRDVKKLLAWLNENPWRQWIAIVLALITPTAAAYVVIVQPSAQPEPTSLRGTRVPSGYTGPVGQLVIDAFPWAELLRLESSSRGVLEVPGTQVTPLVLLVPPGSYRVELGSDGLGTGKLETAFCELEVTAEQTRTCSRVLKTVDAAAYYREIGW